jgi:hypothetical protein
MARKEIATGELMKDPMEDYYTGGAKALVADKRGLTKTLLNFLFDIGKFSTTGVIPDSRFGKALYERLRNPVIGDIVIEVSKLGQQGHHSGSIGIFKGMVWDLSHPDGEKQHKDFYLWQVEAIDTGKTHNWGDARFLALPTVEIRKEVENSLKEERRWQNLRHFGYTSLT